MKRKRKKRPDRLGRRIHPVVRFWTGLTLIPGYFLIDSLLFKILLVMLFALTAFLAGKRIRYFYFLMMTLSITFFHLLTPVGRILWEAGPLKITLGALHTGLLKGVTLSGLVFISLFSVTPSLRLPGKLGGLLARMFYYFEEILDGRKNISAGNFIGSLDRVLMEIFPPDGPGCGAGEESAPAGDAVARSGGWIPPSLYVLILEAAVWGTWLHLLLI